MKKQRYIVEIEMPDGDFISAGWLKDLIQTDCDVEDSGRQIVSVSEVIEPQGLDEPRTLGKGIHKQEYTGCDMSWMDEWKYASKGLDEAAEEYASDEMMGGLAERAFKAGAEWMAGQGITKEAVIGMATEEISINVSEQTLDKLDLCPGDKIIVQIRKAK